MSDSRRLRDAASLAAVLNYRDSIPRLRAIVRGQPDGDVWAQAAAAKALGELGAEDAASELRRLARSSEVGNSTLWETTFEALVQLDSPETAAYARDLAKRTKVIHTVGDRSHVREILPLLVARNATDLIPLLRTWEIQTRPLEPGQTLRARINGARMRLGDTKILARMRTGLGTRNAIVPTWPQHYVGGLGAHPEDVPALLRFASSTSADARAAYDAIDRLTRVMERESGPQWSAARARLVKGLRDLTAHRENRGHVQFEARYLARHHLSLARLEDQTSRTRLLELMRESPETVIPWIAAAGALELELQGSADAASALMLRSAHVPTQLFDVRRALVDQAARTMGASDARWVVMTMDSNPNVRRRALHHMARIRPTEACSVMLEAALAASVSRRAQDGIDEGLLGLTVLGETCRPELEAMMPRRDVNHRVWGVSLELLAMMRSPIARDWASRVRFRSHLRPYAERALAISRLP